MKSYKVCAKGYERIFVVLPSSEDLGIGIKVLFKFLNITTLYSSPLSPCMWIVTIVLCPLTLDYPFPVHSIDFSQENLLEHKEVHKTSSD